MERDKSFKAIDFPPLTDDEKETLEMLDKIPDCEIDYSDIPPCNPDSRGGFYYLQLPKYECRSKL